jgi:hypothetical protein
MTLTELVRRVEVYIADLSRIERERENPPPTVAGFGLGQCARASHRRSFRRRKTAAPRTCGRGASAPDPAILCWLLQRHQNAPIIGQRCANLSPCSADREYRVTRDPRRSSSPLHPGLGFRYTQVATAANTCLRLSRRSRSTTFTMRRHLPATSGSKLC